MTADRKWPPADSPEFDFLSDGLASNLFPENLFPNPSANLDWERLYLILSQNRLAAHFYLLGKSKRNSWPPAFRERLRLDRYRLVMYGEQCKNQIKFVLSALMEANIPVIVMKGWAMIQTIYGGDFGQRVYDDIDILVRPEDVDASECILKSQGWKPWKERRPGYLRSYSNDQHYYFDQPDLPSWVFSIGFHWGLIHHPAYNPKQIDLEALFNRAHPLKISDVPVLEMSIEDHIVYSCAHVVLQHRSEESLLRYYEIAAVIKEANSRLNWQKLEQFAKEWKLVLPLKIVMRKVEEIWPGILPPLAINSISFLKPALSERLIHIWYEKTQYDRSLEHILTWLTMAGLRRRLSFIFEDLFPSSASLIAAYGPAPNGFWFLLYIRRLIRVLGRLRKMKA